jgi:hypothetical protein
MKKKRSAETMNMKSPFPGMDPYLEDPAFWADFHLRFINCWCEAISDQLPGSYDAKLDESVNLVQMSPEVIKLIYPDVAVTHARKRPRLSSPSPSSTRNGGTMLLEPITVEHELLEELREARIEIIHRPNRTLVTVVEMLSPFNKSGNGFDQYRAKRAAILGKNVHLVELDLLVGGKRPTHRKPLPAGDYYAYVSNADRRPDCDIYAWTVRDPLPMLPIPLKAPDTDIHIDLGAVFRETYRRGRYERSLIYGKTPAAPLVKSDATWAKKRSAEK